MTPTGGPRQHETQHQEPHETMDPEREERREELMAAVRALPAQRVVVTAVEAILAAHDVVRSDDRPGTVGLGPSSHKQPGVRVSPAHLDYALPSHSAREVAEEHGFVRQATVSDTTVVRVLATHLANPAKRAGWLELVEAALDHRRAGPDRARPARVVRRQPVKAPRAPRSVPPSGSARPKAPVVPEAPPKPLCPVHGIEMLGGGCHLCD